MDGRIVNVHLTGKTSSSLLTSRLSPAVRLQRHAACDPRLRPAGGGVVRRGQDGAPAAAAGALAGRATRRGRHPQGFLQPPCVQQHAACTAGDGEIRGGEPAEWPQHINATMYALPQEWKAHGPTSWLTPPHCIHPLSSPRWYSRRWTRRVRGCTATTPSSSARRAPRAPLQCSSTRRWVLPFHCCREVGPVIVGWVLSLLPGGGYFHLTEVLGPPGSTKSFFNPDI